MILRYALAVGLGALMSSHAVQAQQASKAPRDPIHDPYKLFLRVDKAPVDEALLELARTAKINIIADADELPATNKTITINDANSKHALIPEEWLTALGHQFGLTWNTANGKYPSPDNRSFVVWRQPDELPLLRRLDREVSVLEPVVGERPDEKPLLHPEGETKDQARLRLYNRQTKQVGDDLMTWLQTQGWDGKALNFQRDFALSQLPEALRQSLMNWAMTPDSIDKIPETRWWDDEPWSRARITLTKDPREPWAFVLAKADFDGAEKFIGIATIDTRQR